MATDLVTGDAVLAGWVDQLAAGVPPRRFPVADTGSPLARIEVAPGLVTLFGGAPGAGKTALVLQLVFDALRLTPALKAVVCNVEMSPVALIERQLARLSGLPLADLRERRVKPDDPRVVAGLDSLRPLAARTAFVRPPYTTTRIAEQADAHQAELVVIDYVQRVAPVGDHASKKLVVDAVTAESRLLAQAGVAVVLVAAVGRTRDEQGRGGVRRADPRLLPRVERTGVRVGRRVPPLPARGRGGGAPAPRQEPARRAEGLAPEVRRGRAAVRTGGGAQGEVRE